MEPLCDILEVSVNRGALSPVGTTAERRKLRLTRVAVILHERLGHWNRQLRPRLHDRPVRWFETRSRADLDGLLIGLACPVVLIDLGRHPIEGLKDLGYIVDRAPDARVLVLDPEAHDQEVAGLARAFGATHVAVGFVPPPFVARLLARWIGLAERQLLRDGWARTSFPKTQTEPWAWLADFLDDWQHPRKIPTILPRDTIAPSRADDGLAHEIAIEFDKNP
jgi:hypothetical protein